jgi:hypothetical protein
MVAETDYFFVIPAILLGLLLFYSACITPSECRLARIGQFVCGLIFFGLGVIFTPSFMAAHNLIP